MTIHDIQEKKQNLAKYQPNAMVGKPGTLRDLLDRFKPEMMKVIPAHVSPERLLKTAMAAMSRQPALLQCTQESVIKSIMTSAELGLDCSGTLGDAYMVPFKNKGRSEAQLIIGYRGLARLARQSGEIKRIEAELVYEKDHFVFSKGTDFKLEFAPRLAGDRGKLLGAYALAEFKDGGIQAEWMTLEDLNKIKARSKAKDFGPWKTDSGEMMRKTVFRRLSKWLPLSADTAFTKAIASDSDASIDAEFEVVGGDEEGIQPHDEIAQQPDESKADAAARAIKAKDSAKAEEGVAEALDPMTAKIEDKVNSMNKAAVTDYAEQIGMKVDGRWSLPKLRKKVIKFKLEQIRGAAAAAESEGEESSPDQPAEPSPPPSGGRQIVFPEGKGPDDVREEDEPEEPDFDVINPSDVEAIASQIKSFADENEIHSSKVWKKFEGKFGDLDDIPADQTQDAYDFLANEVLVVEAYS